MYTIWDRKTLTPELAEGEVPGTVYGLSSSGWMDMELFGLWFKRHFFRYAPAARPLLLLMDGHSSHYCIDTINLARSEEVILFVLPPNTTHLTCPLDKSIFGPLKVKWRDVCYRHLSDNPGCVVTRYDFSTLFGKAWLNTMSIRNIISGFSTTGIFPVNRNAISLPVSSPEQHQPCRRVPLYTPAKKYPSQPLIKLHNPHLSDESLDENGSELDDSQEAYHASENQGLLNRFLKYPSPPLRRGGTVANARVLTSQENVDAINEKKRRKEEEKEKKERRAEERRLKKELKEKEKGLKKKKSKKASPQGICLPSCDVGMQLCSALVDMMVR